MTGERSGAPYLWELASRHFSIFFGVENLFFVNMTVQCGKTQDNRCKPKNKKQHTCLKKRGKGKNPAKEEIWVYFQAEVVCIYRPTVLTHYRIAMPFGNRKKYFRG